MGIINPRPALRKAGARRITNNLRDHADHMARFQAQGMSREDASREAFRMVKAGVPTDTGRSRPDRIAPHEETYETKTDDLGESPDY